MRNSINRTAGAGVRPPSLGMINSGDALTAGNAEAAVRSQAISCHIEPGPKRRSAHMGAFVACIAQVEGE